MEVQFLALEMGSGGACITGGRGDIFDAQVRRRNEYPFSDCYAFCVNVGWLDEQVSIVFDNG
jgi:hypothetical protein